MHSYDAFDSTHILYAPVAACNPNVCAAVYANDMMQNEYANANASHAVLCDVIGS